jgi:hypothetical protein
MENWFGPPCKPEDYDTNKIIKVNLTKTYIDTAYWVYAKSSHKFTFEVIPYSNPYAATPGGTLSIHKGSNLFHLGYNVDKDLSTFGESVDWGIPQNWSQALEYSPATGKFITILPNVNLTPNIFYIISQWQESSNIVSDISRCDVCISILLQGTPSF